SNASVLSPFLLGVCEPLAFWVMEPLLTPSTVGAMDALGARTMPAPTADSVARTSRRDRPRSSERWSRACFLGEKVGRFIALYPLPYPHVVRKSKQQSTPTRLRLGPEVCAIARFHSRHIEHD